MGWTGEKRYTQNGRTALHRASLYGKTEAVNYYLKEVRLTDKKIWSTTNCTDTLAACCRQLRMN